MQWTHDMPTVPGLYAWRDDWDEDTATGALLIVSDEGGDLVCREPFGVPGCSEPLADYEGGEWLGPLPE